MDALSRLYRVRKTCLQMLRDRGYAVPQEDVEMTKDQFRERYTDAPNKEELRLTTHRTADATDKLLVIFPLDVKVGVKTIKGIAESMTKEDVRHAIMIIASNLTPFAKTSLQELGPRLVIEQFTEAELLVNITEHDLVPPHQILAPQEKAQLLDRYKVKDTQLPRIMLHDPVARYLGMQRGQVVRIIRKSDTAGRYVTYRLCM